MRAWQLDDSSPAKLSLQTIPDPVPTAREVLIRVHAAGVTPTELIWYPTTHNKDGSPRHRAVPGHEFSGTIAALGADVRDLALGDEIYGMNDWFAEGAFAEHCVTRPDWIAPKPRTISHAQAASVPISALTAWQGLFDRAKLRAGERVLIHGGSGAVGVYAIQLGRRHGAHVITTASDRNRDFLLQLGAEQVIDYRSERFERILRDIDVVFDGVGGETLERSWDVLATNGRLVTIAADSEGRTDERSKKAFFIVEPNRSQLMTIADLVDAGQLQVVVDAVVPFERAESAYSVKVNPRLGRGKLVLAVHE